jgi:hypothetical protein
LRVLAIQEDMIERVEINFVSAEGNSELGFRIGEPGEKIDLPAKSS